MSTRCLFDVYLMSFRCLLDAYLMPFICLLDVYPKTAHTLKMNGNSYLSGWASALYLLYLNLKLSQLKVKCLVQVKKL